MQLSLAPVAKHLSHLLKLPVLFGDDCMNARNTVDQLPPQGGGVCLLENLRFYREEENNEAGFASNLASLVDAYVNDAFGTSHRAHASTAGVPSILPSKFCGIGSLVASELSYLDFSHVGPKEKIAAVIGGSKVSTKLPVIEGLLKTVDTLVLGGGLAFTFLKAKGISIGSSLLEEELVEKAKELIAQAERTGKNLVLPLDAVCSQTFPHKDMEEEDTKVFDLDCGGIPDDWMGLDIGPKSVQVFTEALSTATKLVFNGPMGVFEVKPFDGGTRGVVEAMQKLTSQGVVTVVGGGDSVAALEAFGKVGVVSYVSTGGGATLELLAGDTLPGVAAIDDVS
jgi:phosphoglycerate kinase